MALASSDAAQRRGLLGWLLVFNLPLLMIVMELSVYAFEPRVLSLRNVVNVLNQSSYLFVFACAQMVVILTRGFDLSLGAAVSTVSVASALAMTGLAKTGLARRRRRRRRARGRTWGRSACRPVQRWLRLRARDQSVRRYARQPQHLPRAFDDDLRRKSGVQRSRRLQPAVLQRRADSRRLHPDHDRNRHRRSRCIFCSTTRPSGARFTSSATIRGRRASPACRAGAFCSWPIWSARCWRRSAG